MKNKLAFTLPIVLLLLFHPASAHPGIGLVMDSKRNIYYTDLKQIWKQTPDGEKSVVVPRVHSHELYMDENDNLYGEHLWYEAATENFLNYHWCLKNTGEWMAISDTLEPFAHPKNYSYVRDENGNMYWYEADEQKGTFHFIRKDTSEYITRLATGTFKDIRWVFSTPEGEIYFLDLDELYTITSKGTFRLVAKNLCTGTPWTMIFGKKHSVFGVWFDQEGNIYAAVTEDRCIKKINPSGQVTVVYKSEKGAVTNGLFDPDHNLWVLKDHSVLGYKTGVQKIHMAEISKTMLWFSNNAKYLLGVLGIGVLVIFIRRVLTAIFLKKV